MVATYRLLGAEEAVQRGVALALDGAPSREAAAAVYDAGLDPEATAAFAIRGIASYINDRLSVMGDQWDQDDLVSESDDLDVPAPTGRNQPIRPHYARDRWERILSAKTWEGADGRRKALLDFTFADASMVRASSLAKVAGHQKVADAMEVAVALLTKHKAETVADLPVKAKMAIAEAVA